jgi:hypothetical protein
MIISHRHEFIFLKTRKTAGTSLEIGLSEYCGPDDIITPIWAGDEPLREELGFPGPQNYTARRLYFGKQRRRFFEHMPAERARKRLGGKIWNNYFKFTIERNPFDKAVSRYWWGTRSEAVRPDMTTFLRSCPHHMLSNWYIYTEGDRVAVDYVIRLETLADDLHCIERKLGIGPIRMVRAKGNFRPDRRHYSEILSGEDRELIEKACRREIEHFSYAW